MKTEEQQLWNSVLRPGSFKLNNKQYRGGVEIKLTDYEYQLFLGWGLISWSDHPDMQMKLATELWQRAMEQFISSGGSKREYKSRHPRPKMLNVGEILVSWDQLSSFKGGQYGTDNP